MNISHICIALQRTQTTNALHIDVFAQYLTVWELRNRLVHPCAMVRKSPHWTTEEACSAPPLATFVLTQTGNFGLESGEIN